jgi:hypothetical protein
LTARERLDDHTGEQLAPEGRGYREFRLYIAPIWFDPNDQHSNFSGGLDFLNNYQLFNAGQQ